MYAFNLARFYELVVRGRKLYHGLLHCSTAAASWWRWFFTTSVSHHEYGILVGDTIFALAFSHDDCTSGCILVPMHPAFTSSPSKL